MMHNNLAECIAIYYITKYSLNINIMDTYSIVDSVLIYVYDNKCRLSDLGYYEVYKLSIFDQLNLLKSVKYCYAITYSILRYEDISKDLIWLMTSETALHRIIVRRRLKGWN